MFSPGDKLEGGHYTIIKELGQGGMGVVYHCHDELLQRDVAIKMLLPELLANQDTVETFHQEARLAAQLEHPNIVTVYDVGKEERRGKVHHYMAMEYLPGGNLAGRVAHSDLSLEHRLNWMKQLATGLTFAHKRGVVHRDIKAENIFITEEGDLKIGDFGLARLAVGRTRTKTVAGMGTPAYMSPELCRGEPQDHRSDIYSMGILFYEVATGELPYKAKGMIEMAMKHTSAPIPSARRLNPQIPETLDKTVQKMLAKMPEDRYQSMAEVLAVLDELIFEIRLARLGLTAKGAVAARGGTGFFSGSAAPTAEPGAAVKGTGAKSSAPARQAGGPLREPTPVNPPPVILPPAGTASGPSAPAMSASGLAAATGAEAPPPGVAPAVEPGPGATAKPAEPMRISRPEQEAAFKAEFELAWTFKTRGPIGWKSMPVADKEGRTIYVGSCDGRLYALDASAGRLLWSFSTAGPIMASPALAADRLVVAGTDCALYCLAPADGRVRWKHQLPGPVVASPALSRDTAYVACMTGALSAVNIEDGFVRWQYDADEEIVSIPQLLGDLLFVTTKGGSCQAISISTGYRKWRAALGGCFVSGPVASSDTVYAGSQAGSFYALEASSGRLIWEYDTGRPIIARGAIVFTSVIFSSLDRWLYCCDKYDGHVMWKAPLKGRVMANLVASSGSIYAVTLEGWAQSFSYRAGESRWLFNNGKRLEAPPLVTPKLLVLSTVDGEVLAYTRSHRDQ